MGGSHDLRPRDPVTRPAVIPPGCWPPRMPADVAAGYTGEISTDAFLSRVGTEYPAPVVDKGRRKIWLKSELDEAMGLTPNAEEFDAADVL